MSETGQMLKELIAERDALRAACEAWMKVESEMADNTPVPDPILRKQYRINAVALTKVALTRTKKEGE